MFKYLKCLCINNSKKKIFQIILPILKLVKLAKWKYYLITSNDIKIIFGAGTTKFEGWFATDVYYLDVTNRNDFLKYFSKKKIDKILAEHVLEHLTNNDLEKMIKNIKEFSSENINVRIAVPDGYHIDENYIKSVKPGGTGDGAESHINLFNYKSLSSLFKQEGFKPVLVEYWDESGNFHHNNLDIEYGFIERSFKYDPRNKNGKPNYTSLIIDFKK